MPAFNIAVRQCGAAETLRCLQSNGQDFPCLMMLCDLDSYHYRNHDTATIDGEDGRLHVYAPPHAGQFPGTPAYRVYTNNQMQLAADTYGAGDPFGRGAGCCGKVDG